MRNFLDSLFDGYLIWTVKGGTCAAPDLIHAVRHQRPSKCRSFVGYCWAAITAAGDWQLIKPHFQIYNPMIDMAMDL